MRLLLNWPINEQLSCSKDPQLASRVRRGELEGKGRGSQLTCIWSVLPQSVRMYGSHMHAMRLITHIRITHHTQTDEPLGGVEPVVAESDATERGLKVKWKKKRIQYKPQGPTMSACLLSINHASRIWLPRQHMVGTDVPIYTCFAPTHPKPANPYATETRPYTHYYTHTYLTMYGSRPSGGSESLFKLATSLITKGGMPI